MIIKNFLFHRVSDETDALWPPMKPVLFEKIIKKLSIKYNVVNLEAYLRDNNAIRKSSKQVATVLFDDGYKDNIEYAAPILKKYNCPASFYIITDCIDRNIPTWTYIVDYIVQNTTQTKIELHFDYVPDLFKKIILKASPNYPVVKLKPWIKTLPNKLRNQIMQAIMEQCSDVLIPRNKMMNWSEIQQLHNDEYTIGSHTHTHPMLGKLEDGQEIENELQTSFSKIKNELGNPPETISYPIGSYDERVMKLSEKVGYKWGLAVDQQFYKQGKDNIFAIPRVELYQQPWYKVHLRMAGVHSIIKNIRK